jgi:two-component system phosphate regulon sensor histidine kinase PhoR
MTNKKYKIFIFTTIITLLGLIFGLTLVFNENFKIQKSQLDQQIQSSMIEVSDLLAQNEKVSFLKSSDLFDIDSLLQIHSKDSSHVIIKKGVDFDTSFVSGDHMESRIEIRMESQTSDFSMSDSENVEYHIESTQIGEAKGFAEIIKRALGESKTSRGKSFNEDTIRHFLKDALNNNGFEASFTFGVIDHKKDSFICGDSSAINYSTSLFPLDVIEPNRYELRLDSEHLTKTILSNMRWSLILLIVFTIAIICCFSYALHIINKQKKIDQVKSDFINNMTHEFKTPLASISLASDTILHENVIGDMQKTKELVHLIKDEKSKMMHHVERVLEIARLDNDALELNTQALNFSDLVQKTIDNFSPILESVSGKFEINIEKDISIYGDEYHLKNALMNVIDNSIKYGQEKLVIEISSIIENKTLILSIKDNGIGISKDNLNQVFDKFFREETGNVHNVKGFGLGLSYVKKIVELHKGTVTINSQKGTGTTVEIKLPIHG